MENVKMYSPWVVFANEVKKLFERDEEVEVKYDNDEVMLSILVSNQDKYEALRRLIPARKEFGNVTLDINVIPANVNYDNASEVDLVKRAFARNPAIHNIRTYNTPFGDVTYVAFDRCVVSVDADDMSDPNGYKSTLYQEIAKDIFNLNQIFFCTAESFSF